MGVQLRGQWKDMDKAFKNMIKPDLRPMLSAIGEGLITETLKRFDDQEDPKGKKWKELKESTIERRRTRKDKPNKRTKILLDTGRLRASITKEVTKDTVAIGTNVTYALTHQLGDKHRKIPKREYLGISKRDNDSIGATVKDFIDRNMGG